MRWFILAAMLVCSGVAKAQQVADRPLPNIVILYADDLGYGDLQCYNSDSKIPTPHLNTLAAEGLRLTDAHSSSGICTPSRYALLAGRYHWRKFHGIVNSFGPSVFAEDELTLPELLRSRGYRTACIGKWHLGWDWRALQSDSDDTDARNDAADQAADKLRPFEFDWSRSIPNGPLAHGFDYYFGDDVPNFPPYTWIENDRVLQVPSEPYAPNPVPEEGAAEGRPGPMAAGWEQDQVMPELTRRAVAWLEQAAQDDAPFFLYFPFTSPHAPIIPADEFKGTSQAGPYGDFVAQTDWTVGQILQTLEALQLSDDTLVLFSSDNGPEHYAYERMRQFEHRSPGPLRGLKRDIWEGGHRVPCIVRWPGQIPAGQVSDELFSQIDVWATVAQIIGAEIPADAAHDSYNQWPLWQGSAPSAREWLVHNTKQDHYAIRQGNWLLIADSSGTVTKVPPWVNQAAGYVDNDLDVALYDLVNDLGQKNNLAASQDERVQMMTARLEQIRRAGQVRPGGGE